MTSPRFSVFTATYNRKDLIPKVYNGLLNQTYRNFEWVIIDDGSTDNTEELIGQYIKEKEIPNIIYLKKENGGKHTAWREATKLFRGKYVLSIDSDDELLPNALEIFNKYWTELEKSNEFESFWEVKARGQYEDGTLVGNPLPSSIFDTHAPLLHYKYKVRGDLHGCRKLSVLKNEAKVPDKFIFEENCSNFSESIRWFRAGRKYKTRYIEERTMCVSLNASDRLSANINKKTFLKKSYNSLVHSIYILNENRNEMFKWSPLSYLKTIFLISYQSMRLNLNVFTLPEKKFYLLDVFLLIFSYLPVYITFKIREKKKNENCYSS